MAKTKPKEPSLAERLKAHPDLLAKYMKNPGLRSKLPDSYLTPAQRKQRILNARLNAPVVPGSSVTGRDLAQESNAATALRYGPQERALTTQQAQARQQGIDQAGWYDQYKADLQQHATNTGQISAAAVGQMNATGAGLRGLDQSNLQQQQGALNADAATRGATAATLGPEADAASRVRQQMLAGFANQQSATGAANQTYADSNANVVAPAQKMRARAQSAADVRAIGDKLISVAADKGAYQQQYRAGVKSDEAKNVLAQQALTGKTAVDLAKITATTTRADRTAADRKAAAAGKVNQWGYTAAQWAAMTVEQRRAIIKGDKTKPKKVRPTTGPGSAAYDRKVAANNKVRATIETARADAENIIGKQVAVLGVDGKPEVDTDGKPTNRTRPVTREEARANLRKRYKDADVANAAIELAQDGYVHPVTAQRLRSRGIGVPKAWLTPPQSNSTTVKPKGDPVLAGAITGAVK